MNKQAETHKSTEPKQQRISPKDVVQRIRAEAKKNKAFEAVCHIFAIRERARAQVTLSALRLTMSREGFHFTKAEHEHVLKFLASLGIGKLDYDTRGVLRGLKEIRVSLQSIGLAAVDKADKLENFAPANSFADLPLPDQGERMAVAPMPLRTNKEPLQRIGEVRAEAPSVVTVIVGEKKVNLPLPRSLTIQEATQLLANMYVETVTKK